MNPFVTNPQSMGVSERIAYGVVFWLCMRLAARGYLTPDMAEYIALGIVAGGGAVIGWWQNRPKILLETAANIPNPDTPSGKTVVIASPELAASTPTAPTVISSTDVRIVPQ
jgi:hypothetical protein